MKNFTFLLFTIIASQLLAQTTITHSVSQSIDEGSPSCPIETTNYLRVFDLENEFGITDAFEIIEVEFGVWRSDVSEEITINLYTSPTVDIVTGPLTLIYTNLESTINGEISIHNMEPKILVPTGGILVFELAEKNDGVEFLIGANEEGQTSPSWIKSPICGFQTVESAGFISHFVVNITGLEFIFGDEDTIVEQVTVFPNPVTDILNIDIPSHIIIEDVNLYTMTGMDTNLQITDMLLDMSGLANGVYFLTIVTSEGELVKKIIK